MPLCTKVRMRWKLPSTLLLLLLIPLLTQEALASAPKCDKTPTGQQPFKTPGDNGFAVSVAGSPTLYRPGQMYTVSLGGFRVNPGAIEPSKIKFIDFLLVAESHLPATEVPDLGVLQLMPDEAMSKFSQRCSHAIKATSAVPKDEVKVLWTAPEAGNGCIQLKAMVVERKDVWYMDDGALTYTFCEDNSPMGTPPLVEPCCACDEAKYEVIFEGLWSRHTHPKDYPIDEWKTQFSHMIGASHSIEYDLWKYGELASPALTMLAATGQPKKLEIDMKRYSEHIRSVIKARGLQQRSNVVGRTFAVFRMDSTNHLLSLVSKMIPSPDWIVGVSMENLCLANCSWVDSRVVDLYPWDAGILSGLTYNDPGDETMPRESIRRITACNPENEASPFFDPTCAPLKPVARLHILKQREYKKQCPNGQSGPGLPLNPSWGSNITPHDLGADADPSGPAYPDYEGSQTYNDFGSSSSSYSDKSYTSTYRSNTDNCQMKEWSEWTRCSQTCGKGSQSRTRVWMNPIGAAIANCPQGQLFAKRVCQNQANCPARSYQGSYDPFYGEEETGLAGYSSTWVQRGLSSGNLKKEEVPSLDTKSYLYTGNNDDKAGSSYTYSSSGNSYSDPYYDPYNKHSGYAKQKGYPPATNLPGSANYNPYKALGYYGYSYGGPGGSQNTDQQAAFRESSVQSEVQGDSSSSGTCRTEEWGDWSDCSVACGQGTRSRKRYYKDQDTSTCSAELDQMDQCTENSGCQEAVPLPHPQRRVRKGPYMATDPQCSVAAWTDWSPCSVSCGHGYMIRTRVYKLSFVPYNRVCEGVRLSEKRDCRLKSCGWLQYYDEVQPMYYSEDAAILDEEPISVEVHDDAPGPREPYCLEDPDPGRCRVEISRWYYNSREGNCQEFTYSGCGGNRNSFTTQQMCMDTCHTRKTSAFKDLMSMSLVREGYMQDAAAPTHVDCQISGWSDWSDCSMACGRGWITKTRSIVTQPSPGGRACPRKLEKRRKCRGHNCSTNPSDWYQGNWRMLQDKDDIRN